MVKEIKTVAIIQARMGSTRLPGKVLAKIEGKSLLQHLVERIRKSKKIDSNIIATSTKKDDSKIEELAKKIGIKCFRGPENDVLGRYKKAAEKFKADIIVRITADNPLTDPWVTDKMICHLVNRGLDYVCVKGMIDGLASEVITLDAIKKADKLSSKEYHREHVTTFIKDSPRLFNIGFIDCTKRLKKPEISVSVDTKEDLAKVRAIYKKFYKKGTIFSSEKIVEFFDNKNKKSNILFRVDGSNKLGMGHIIRSVAIANELRKSKNMVPIFLTKNFPIAIKKIKENNFHAEIIPRNTNIKEEIKLALDAIKKTNSRVVMTDIQNINLDFLKGIKRKIDCIVSIDDLGSIKKHADIIINGSVVDKRLIYKNKMARYFLGPKHMIINQSFAGMYKKKKKIAKKISSILVTMGGSDPRNLTLKVINALTDLNDNIKITILVGSAFKNIEKIMSLAKNMDNINIRHNVKNIQDYMYKADIAFCSGGISSYELAACGTPAIFLPFSKIESLTSDTFEKKGFGINMGLDLKRDKITRATKRLIRNRKLRAKMSKAGKKLVDGKSMERAIGVISRIEVLTNDSERNQ